jgi:hypothetical protein
MRVVGRARDRAKRRTTERDDHALLHFYAHGHAKMRTTKWWCMYEFPIPVTL